MRFLITLLAVLTISLTQAGAASANDWMFRRSYYSHALVDQSADAPAEQGSMFPQPVPRSAYRPAHAQIGPGFAVRGHYRYNVYRLWSGRSLDTTIFREFSFEGTAAR